MKKNIILFMMILVSISNYILPSQDELSKTALAEDALRQMIALKGEEYVATQLKRKYGTMDFRMRSNGSNFFHSIVARNYVTLVEEFIRQGANTTLKDKYNKTPYDYARTPEMKQVFLREAIDFCYDPKTGNHALIRTRKYN